MIVGLGPPQELAALGVDGIDEALLVAEIRSRRGACGRWKADAHCSPDRRLSLPAPVGAAALRIEREDAARRGGDEESVTDDHRRAIGGATRIGEAPFHAQPRDVSRRDAGHALIARVRRVAADAVPGRLSLS